MRLSQNAWRTYKEDPSDAEIPSHRLMIRAGLIHKAVAGIFNFLPFGYKVVRKIEQIVREELNRINAQEILMSVVTPGELWKQSGRWDSMTEMLKFKDKKESNLCISPTNEEAVVDIFSTLTQSYKELPINLYQINTKFRDEIRPRFGIMRGREFIMKDAYTFHINEDCLEKSYNDYYCAYENILKRIGVDYIVVEADAGAMADGGQKNHEFQLLAKTGEDTIVYSPSYKANLETAQTKRKGLNLDKTGGPLKEIDTPHATTIEAVAHLLKKDPSHCIKSLLYEYSNEQHTETVLVQLLGDDALNESKLKHVLQGQHLRKLSDEKIKELGFVKGYIGAHNAPSKIRVIFDLEVDEEAFYITGANLQNKHFCNFRPKRDVDEYEKADLRLAKEGDLSWNEKEDVHFCKGIEVGHIFQLGHKYTKAMGVSVLDEKGKSTSPLMGCYGLGITRLVAAVIEQCHDEKGIIWPKSIAPYHFYLINLSKKEEIQKLGDEIYSTLLENKIEVIFDDRNVSSGVKFQDSDLLGIPVRLILSDRNWRDNKKIEWVERTSGEKKFVSLKELFSLTKDFYEWQ